MAIRAPVVTAKGVIPFFALVALIFLLQFHDPSLQPLSSYYESMLNAPTILSKNATTASQNTVILGFSDDNYKEIASRWYQGLEKLGYTEHVAIAWDPLAAEFFRSQNMRYDVVFSGNVSMKDQCPFFRQKKQLYRRSLFASRWNYVLRQLQKGKHVLLTDVDNVFVRHVPLSELEDSPFDAYHAYAGVPPSFPLDVYYQTAVTICGGMSFLKSTPAILQLVQAMVDKCKCQTLTCHCRCDDQVVLNYMLLLGEFKVLWDDGPPIKANVTTMSWEGLAGTCSKTGHRLKVWDRHTAYRADFDPQICPDSQKSWIAMPTGLPKETIWENWTDSCVRV